MTCEGCAGHLRTVTGELRGVTSAQVSYVVGTATVAFAAVAGGDEGETAEAEPASAGVCSAGMCGAGMCGASE